MFGVFLLFDLGASPLPLSHSHKRVVKVEEADSDSEDLSLTPSLAEISSDDLSWLEDPGKNLSLGALARWPSAPKVTAIPHVCIIVFLQINLWYKYSNRDMF